MVSYTWSEHHRTGVSHLLRNTLQQEITDDRLSPLLLES